MDGLQCDPGLLGFIKIKPLTPGEGDAFTISFPSYSPCRFDVTLVSGEHLDLEAVGGEHSWLGSGPGMSADQTHLER